MSIRWKLSGLGFGMVATLVAVLTIYLTLRFADTARATLDMKARMYGQLFARELEPAVAFGDRETAREVFEAAAVDPDVIGLALVAANGDSLGALGELSASPEAILRGSAPNTDAIVNVSPVVAREGGRGTLIVELGTESLHAEVRHIITTAVVAGLSAIALGFFAAWILSGSLAARLRTIQRATRAVATGDLDHAPLDDKSNDEIGALATDFDIMAHKLRDLVTEISRRAGEEQARLDALVNLRTAELAHRNQEMRLVLDNVDQGFAMIDRQGNLSSERSRMFDRWLGATSASEPLFTLFSRVDSAFGDASVFGWTEVQEGFMPEEITLLQMPQKLTISENHYQVVYVPIGAEPAANFLVVVSDTTDEVKRELAERERQDAMGLFERVLTDQRGVKEFFTEASALIETLRGASHFDQIHLMRALHTLKGNCAIFGLTALAEECHSLESFCIEQNEIPNEAATARLLTLWESAKRTVDRFLDEGDHFLQLSQKDFASLEQGLCSRTPHAELLTLLRSLRLEPIGKRLEKFAEQARRMASRMGKTVDVIVEDNDVRVDPLAFSEFWSAFIHVIRNAVDHGIEPDDLRRESGKTSLGRISLRAHREQGQLRLEVEDNGPGIDWTRVASKAREKGLPSETSEDLRAALLSDGLSTRENVSHLSGRGVGMAAVHAATESLGGTIAIDSHLGHGTLIQMRFQNMVSQSRPPRAA